MPSSFQTSESPNDPSLTVAVVGRDRQRRIAATSALAQCGNVEPREFSDYPAGAHNMPQPLERGFDAVLVDLDGDPEVALELVETLCVAPSAIVMVFSEQGEPQLMLRSMRAGAREFFTLPFKHSTLAKALSWVATQNQATPVAKKSEGRLLVFFGSRGALGSQRWPATMRWRWRRNPARARC